MEAGAYLGEGYATRLMIESQPAGWTSLSAVARTWQPSRLKGIQISPEHGTPFLTATQVYDVRPTARKWLSIERTDDYAARFVGGGQIVVTCSGNVGRATLVHATTNGALVSHDLLRVDAKEEDWWGWIYAYLRAPTVRKVMKAAQYGHIIKHLETHHLDSLPIVHVNDGVRAAFGADAREVLQKRDRAYTLIVEAEGLFTTAFGGIAVSEAREEAFTTRVAGVFGGRRRLDAAHHSPTVKSIVAHMSRSATGWVSVVDLGFDVWLPSRFKRIAASDGPLFLDSSDLFEINPDIDRRIAEQDFGDAYAGRVKRSWILMARSGQIYGLIGTAMMTGAWHEGKVVSDDVIRIAPREQDKDALRCRPGYVVMAMTHPELGRPRVKALPYGSSIPHVDVADIERFQLPRLQPSLEIEIADRVEQAAQLRDEADELERRLADSADAQVRRFVEGRTG